MNEEVIQSLARRQEQLTRLAKEYKLAVADFPVNQHDAIDMLITLYNLESPGMPEPNRNMLLGIIHYLHGTFLGDVCALKAGGRTEVSQYMASWGQRGGKKGGKAKGRKGFAAIAPERLAEIIAAREAKRATVKKRSKNGQEEQP